jgi:NAD(P)-dependent dehydrogenase (short-subunit alcohol dehydrogenase family)
MKRLEGKTAVITGATGGIGRAACRVFCAEGASVLGCDVDPEAGRLLEAQLAAEGLPFRFVPCDVSSSEEVGNLAAAARGQFSGLDILFNNAGVILGRALVETTDEDWDRILAVNLRGTFLTMRALVPLMAGRQAAIVNMSSGLGLVGSEMLTAYSASKGGVIMLTKSAALELGPEIRVNAICPGVVDTPMPREINPEGGEEFMRGMEEIHVAKRLARPEEIVAMAVFLASDEASFVTGAAIPVDSGVTAR